MLLNMERVCKTYGDRTLLDHVTFYMKQGDRVGVVGVNGCGKSTFLRLAAGREKPDSGAVSYDPNVRLGYLPQDPPFDPENTVMEQVEAGLDKTAREVARYEAVEILTRLGITDTQQKMGSLSGGQRKRVAGCADLAEEFDYKKGISVEMLADLLHQKKQKTLKQLQRYIRKSWLTAWLDEKNEKLYLTVEDYRAAQEEQKAAAAAASKAETQPKQDADAVPLNLEVARSFAQVLKKEKALMQDERAVEELDHMQKTTQAICDWLEAHPESLPKARRFAEYYIPTTLKLLHTYNDVQGQQGENAEAIRRDIAGILHTLNQAYDNLYDKLLSDVALDVSSEIAALQGMLANDGLTGEGML